MTTETKINRVLATLDYVCENPQQYKHPEFIAHLLERKVELLETKLELTYN